MKRKPTSRQRVLKFIEKFWTTYGYPPTMWEISTALRFGSVESVRYHLKALHADGLIEWQSGRSRTIRLAGFVWNPQECPNVRAPSDKLVVRLWSVRQRSATLQKMRDKLAAEILDNRNLVRRLKRLEHDYELKCVTNVNMLALWCKERDDLQAQLAALSVPEFEDDEWDADGIEADWVSDEYLLRQAGG